MKWTAADKRRRWFGLFYLITALGMFIWGQTILEPHLRGFLYIIYWLLVFSLTILAMLTAALDIWIVRLRQRRSENDAARETFKPPVDSQDRSSHKTDTKSE